MLGDLLLISLGASLGACSRWVITKAMQPLLSNIAAGTLAVNLLGAFIIGLLMGILSARHNLAEGWTLFLVTGFLGSLTTFSAFTAELSSLLGGQQFLWAGLLICLHVCGSVLLFFLGAALARAF